MTDPAEPTKPVGAPDGPRAEQVGRKRRFRRVGAFVAPVRRVLHKIPHPPWRSKRGIFLLFVLFGGFGAVATMGGVTAVGFSETPAFCGSCHTMEPAEGLRHVAPQPGPMRNLSRQPRLSRIRYGESQWHQTAFRHCHRQLPDPHRSP